MTLESDLRAAFSERVARVPTNTRLIQIDYHPRTRRLKPPIALGSIATAGGIAGVVIALTSGASTAFAGWKAQPTAPSPQQIALAQASCASRQSPISGLPLVLSDTRGPFTFQVYANDHASASCITGPSFTSIAGSFSSAAVTVPAGKIQASVAHTTTRDGNAYAFSEGRTGAGVTGVTFDLSDGTKVTATVQNGWYVAWWPGARQAKAAEVTTASGTTTQPIDEGSPCGRYLCTGGQSGSSGSGSVAAAGVRGAVVTRGFSISK
jgi:hypothetical protein